MHSCQFFCVFGKKLAKTNTHTTVELAIGFSQAKLSLKRSVIDEVCLVLHAFYYLIQEKRSGLRVYALT